MNSTPLLKSNPWLVRAGIAVCALAIAAAAAAERFHAPPLLTWSVLFLGLASGLILSSAKPWREWLDYMALLALLTGPLALISGLDSVGLRVCSAFAWIVYLAIGVFRTHYVPGQQGRRWVLRLLAWPVARRDAHKGIAQ